MTDSEYEMMYSEKDADKANEFMAEFMDRVDVNMEEIMHGYAVQDHGIVLRQH